MHKCCGKRSEISALYMEDQLDRTIWMVSGLKYIFCLQRYQFFSANFITICLKDLNFVMYHQSQVSGTAMTVEANLQEFCLWNLKRNSQECIIYQSMWWSPDYFLILLLEELLHIPNYSVSKLALNKDICCHSLARLSRITLYLTSQDLSWEHFNTRRETNLGQFRANLVWSYAVLYNLQQKT